MSLIYPNLKSPKVIEGKAEKGLFSDRSIGKWQRPSTGCLISLGWFLFLFVCSFYLPDGFFPHDDKRVSDEKRHPPGFLLEGRNEKAGDRLRILLSFISLKVNLQYRQKTQIVRASVNYTAICSGDKTINKINRILHSWSLQLVMNEVISIKWDAYQEQKHQRTEIGHQTQIYRAGEMSNFWYLCLAIIYF